MLSQRRSLCAAAACSGLGWPRVEAEDIGGAEAVKAMEIAPEQAAAAHSERLCESIESIAFWDIEYAPARRSWQ